MAATSPTEAGQAISSNSASTAFRSAEVRASLASPTMVQVQASLLYLDEIAATSMQHDIAVALTPQHEDCVRCSREGERS
jgi:hypothetical protein